MGIKETIRQWLGFLSLGILGLGFVFLAINALAALFGWMGGSNKRQIAFHITSFAGFIVFVAFAAIFVFVYWFRAAAGYELIKDRLPKMALIFLVIMAVSRVLSPGVTRAYGPLDGLVWIGGTLLLAWPLWAEYQAREPRSEPPAEPQQSPGPVGPGADVPGEWSDQGDLYGGQGYDPQAGPAPFPYSPGVDGQTPGVQYPAPPQHEPPQGGV